MLKARGRHRVRKVIDGDNVDARSLEMCLPAGVVYSSISCLKQFSMATQRAFEPTSGAESEIVCRPIAISDGCTSADPF
jgi:hypothetical protein